MSIHRLVLTDGLNPIESGLTNNYLFDCLYGGYPVLTFTNEHTSALTLTNILLADNPGFQDVSVIWINGASVNYPYTIAQGESIDVLIEFYGSPGTWGLTLVTAEHNNDAQYQFQMTAINGSDLWDSLDMDFGNVPMGTTASIVRTMTNICCDTQYVQFTTGQCALNSGLVEVGAGIGIPPTQVPPGATVSFTLQWTPNAVGQILNCNLYDSVAGCAYFNATGEAVETLPEHHIELVAGLYTDGTVNRLLCCGECGINVSQFENKVGSPLDITNIILDTTSSGVTVNILTINGITPSFPITIPAFEEFTVEFEVCWDGITAPLGTWSLTIETTQYGLDLPYEIAMACIDSVYFFPGDSYPINFVDAIAGLPSTQSIVGANVPIFSQTLDLSIVGCTGITVSQNPVIISQENYPSFDITWTPTEAGQTLSCTIQDQCDIGIPLIGNSIEAPCEDCMCCQDIVIKTENNYLPPQTMGCDMEALYTTASFLEKKTIVFSMVYPLGINSQWKLQFNPAIFIQSCLSPFEGDESLAVYYSITYLQSFMPDGTPQQMTLVGAGSSALNRKNWECYFIPINAALGTFQVEFTFYQIHDADDFINIAPSDNLNKILRNSISATSNFTNTMPAVYNTNKVISGAFLTIDPINLTEDFEFTRCPIVSCANYTARFYDKGLYNNPTEFLSPSWVLTRTVGTVTNFSVFEKTKVEFRITIPPIYGSGTPVIIFHLFDVTNIDNTVDFLTSSDTSRFRIQNFAGTGVLDNHLVRPAGINSVSGEWRGYMNVGTTVNPSSLYLIAAIVYDSAGTMVNTFLSPRFEVREIPDMYCDCTPSLDSSFNQYWVKTNTDCFRPVGKERIGHELKLNGDSFTDCLELVGVYAFDWRFQLYSVRLNIYKKVDDYPNVGNTTFFQYQTHLSTRNNAMPGGFQNLNDLVVYDDGINDISISINNIRVPWEDIPFSSGTVLKANTSTFLNRTAVGGLSPTYVAANSIVESWIDEDVYFEYVITFELRDQVGYPFFWNVIKAYKVNAIEEEPTNSGNGNHINGVTIEGLDPITGLYIEIEEPICFKDWDAIKLTYEADRPGNFIFFMEKEPYGFYALKENNEQPSTEGMIQLSEPLVLSMDTQYDASYKASVVLNLTNVFDGKYKFCGYHSEPEAALVCDYFLKHTRNGGTGVTLPSVIQYGTSFQVTWSASAFGYLWMSCQLGFQAAPIPGQTYVFEYLFSSPTTLLIELWFGQHSYVGTPITIPIGSTSGSFSFVWGTDALTGKWTMRSQTGTPMTALGTFKIGNQLCP
jgi:hypothetical protein